MDLNSAVELEEPNELEEPVKPDNLEEPTMSDLEQDVEKEIPAETIEITEKKNILPYLKPQETKYWHFTFKSDADKNKFTNTIETIPGYNITVEYGIPKNAPDVTLKINGDIVGKIHFLLSDRRDANLPNKYYCKLYFYHFKNEELYENVKKTVIHFFENFKTTNKKGGKSKKHITKKRITKKVNHRKKTLRHK